MTEVRCEQFSYCYAVSPPAMRRDPMTTERFAIYYTADIEGDWCQACAGIAYPSREAAQAALDCDPTAKPDCNGNACYPEVVAVDDDGYADIPGLAMMIHLAPAVVQSGHR